MHFRVQNVFYISVQTINNDNNLPQTASAAASNDNGERKAKRTRCNVDTCRRKLGLTGIYTNKNKSLVFRCTYFFF